MMYRGLLLAFLLASSSCLADECGNPAIPPTANDNGGGRVINGQEAVPHSFPWTVAIESYFGDVYCGGSVLTSEWILTAAHCAEIVFIGEYGGDAIVFGAHDRRESNEGKQVGDYSSEHST